MLHDFHYFSCLSYKLHGFHPQQICQNRNPRVCKWFRKTVGCKREENCEFLHVTSTRNDCDGINAGKENSYKCESEQYVMKHSMKNK